MAAPLRRVGGRATLEVNSHSDDGGCLRVTSLGLLAEQLGTDDDGMVIVIEVWLLNRSIEIDVIMTT